MLHIMIISLLFLLFLGCGDSSKKEDDLSLQIRSARLDSIASAYQAIVNWDEQLPVESRGISGQIFSVDLERVWTKQPIVFECHIEDIQIHSDTHYLIFASQSVILNILRNTNLGLELVCPKSLVDRHLDIIRQDFIKLDNLAIVAQVEHVVSKNKVDSYGEEKRYLTGLGKCVNIIPLD